MHVVRGISSMNMARRSVNCLNQLKILMNRIVTMPKPMALKKDRLAKVSKVASFMYGRNEVQIIDADTLVSHEDNKPESFDILVAILHLQ